MIGSDRPEVIIVGAGLAGLSCARRLQEDGFSFLVVEAADAVGGRVRTDAHEGFLLDRGFQVLLTAYPEAQRGLDYSALDLRAFEPGALVRIGGRFRRLTDPWRRPLGAISALFNAPGTLADLARIARLRRRVGQGSIPDLFRRPEIATVDALRRDGFTNAMIDGFFRPFLGGILLDRELRASSRMFEFVFRMLAEGQTAIPAAGMGAIPDQLAARLPPESIRTGARTTSISPGRVTLASGEELRSRIVVVATEEPEAARLTGHTSLRPSRGVTCLYFAADDAPFDGADLVLDGDGAGPVNNLCVPSNVASGYAPPGAALISATILGLPNGETARLENSVREQLSGWFGPAVQRWKHLRTYAIRHAQPGQEPPALADPQRPVRLVRGLFICGDHLDNASINGAMVSGRRAAEAIAAEMKD